MILLRMYENGEILIDTKANRKTRIPLEKILPVSKETALLIFEKNDYDYEVESAIKYFESEKQ